MHDIALRYGVDLAQVPMVGDTARDLLAAQAAGCQPHLVQSGRAAGLEPGQVKALLSVVPAAHAHASLGAFADFVLQHGDEDNPPAGRLNP
jgi:D-glycero-D-manno-heptose 1,7-bisphosphate phosphatase